MRMRVELTWKEVLLDVALDTSQEEWPQDLVQRLHDLLALLLVTLRLRVILVQEALQVRVVREDLWADEVQQREELLHVVLQRRARDEQPAAGQERAHDLGEDRVDVLDTVGLVDDAVLERELHGRVVSARQISYEVTSMPKSCGSRRV